MATHDASAVHVIDAGRRRPYAAAAMKPAPFHYHAPKTIEEAVATLARVAHDDGRLLAGGPRRIAQAEAALTGRAPNAATFAAAAEAATKAVDPLHDENTSAACRRGLVRTVILRALAKAVA